MATLKSIPCGGEDEASKRAIDYAFRPFKYGRDEIDTATLPGGNVQRFANLVESISQGSSTILDLIEWDEMRADEHTADPAEPPPLLNRFHKGVLLRLVATHMEVLSREAEDIKSWAYDHHTDAGKAAQLEEATRLVEAAAKRATRS